MFTFRIFIAYLTSRAKERSTWLGLTSLFVALGLTLSPEQTESVIALGMALAGLIAAFSKDAVK